MKDKRARAIEPFVCKKVDSPIGGLVLVGNDDGLNAILWANDNPRRVRRTIVAEDNRHPVLLETARQLDEYFSGTRHSFDMKLNFIGTAFQKRVWRALLQIPFGETRSYGQIARELGNPRATRAVGAANGKNPIAIIAPCHRLIGASGALTGFAGGLKAKATLLALEKAGRQTGARGRALTRRAATAPRPRRASPRLAPR
jgi:methylated-DNA-[protein]-cysteine S-methyltransferase